MGLQMQLMGFAKAVLPPTVRRLLRPAVARILGPSLPWGKKDADQYVGTDEISGQLQFELLRREGCRPSSKVLEVGCGNLHAGIPLIHYLEKDNYVGIDPNEWLRNSAMEDAATRHLVKSKRARFVRTTDFDASPLGVKFDFVLSHSILSHCAHWQLDLFLRNVSKVLAPNGRIVASIRLAEGNKYGSSGTPNRDDSKHETWQYPGVTWFRLSTVKETAAKHGLTAICVPEYTEFYTATRPNEFHDWLIFSAGS